MNEFSNGVISMVRNTLPAIDLIRNGTWSLWDMERWLNAVIESDANYLKEPSHTALAERAKEKTKGAGHKADA